MAPPHHSPPRFFCSSIPRLLLPSLFPNATYTRRHQGHCHVMCSPTSGTSPLQLLLLHDITQALALVFPPRSYMIGGCDTSILAGVDAQEPAMLIATREWVHREREAGSHPLSPIGYRTIKQGQKGRTKRSFVLPLTAKNNIIMVMICCNYRPRFWVCLTYIQTFIVCCTWNYIFVVCNSQFFLLFLYNIHQFTS